MVGICIKADEIWSKVVYRSCGTLRYGGGGDFDGSPGNRGTNQRELNERYPIEMWIGG
jgi:hypothetical protein